MSTDQHLITLEERRKSRLGELALERGLLSSAELEALLEREHARAGTRLGVRRLGEALVAGGHASADLLDELLEEQRHQRQHEPLTGKFRVPGPPTPRDLEDYLAHAQATD